MKQLGLRSELTRTREDLVQLVCKMVCYNPLLRVSADQLLKDKIFDGIRVNQNELIGKKMKAKLNNSNKLQLPKISDDTA